MYIIKIMGGIGNQLFTYAFAYALARANQEELLLDEEIYHTYYKLRTCELDRFNIRYTNRIIENSFGTGRIQRKIYGFYHSYLLKYKYKAHLIEENDSFSFRNFELEKNENFYFCGYWQNYRYFQNYRDELAEQFVPNIINDELEAAISYLELEQPIIVHIRRGDYKSYRGGACLSLQYYYSAISHLRDISGNDRKILIFTDDIDFCKENFCSYSNVEYFSERFQLSDVNEFYAMTKSKYYIIANSTFSWWAAYLSNSNDKVVIAPVVDQWNSDFYLPEWIKLETELEKGE